MALIAGFGCNGLETLQFRVSDSMRAKPPIVRNRPLNTVLIEQRHRGEDGVHQPNGGHQIGST
jgi:hypothetical protein